MCRLIEDEISTVDEDFNIQNLTNYILQKIYFVVIDTKAGLSKTLQIFNTINTTGMDLAGSDLFKIRMFEYLTKHEKDKEKSIEVFNQINSLYAHIDNKNNELKLNNVHFRQILEIYQIILIGKYNLPLGLHDLGVDTFFERLFDTLLGIETHQPFKAKAPEIKLTIKDLESIIKVRYLWDEHEGQWNAEDLALIHFIGWSRYRHYWLYIFTFLFRFNPLENPLYWQQHFLYIKNITRYLLIKSIHKKRSVYHTHNYLRELNKLLFNTQSTPQSLIEDIEKKIQHFKGEYPYTELQNILNGPITDNYKQKNIICRLSAMIDELQDPNCDADNLKTRLFINSIDIEHIQSYNDYYKEKRPEIWETWKEEINSLGNLMVLESGINTSISNNPFHAKVKRYNDSTLATPHKIAKSHGHLPNWELSHAQERKTKEVNKILNYLFEGTTTLS
ncbi:MAG: HNH endonuclease family protein [Flavobacteriaceae bacterium]|nr:HNH endonuclease [Flavobacteriaceae bacterium]